MKKINIVISVLFFLSLYCMIPSSCGWAELFAQAINNGNGGTFSLDGTKTYTGGADILADTILNGNNALIDLGSADLAIKQGSHFNVQSATISGGRLLVLGNPGYSKLTADGVIFSNRVNGIYADYGRLVLRNCHFDQTMYGISLANVSIIEEMSNCIVENCQDSGICCSNSQMNNLYGNTFKNITNNGIYMNNSSTLQLKSPENTFDSCPYGISSADSSLTLDTGSCRFTTSYTALFITNPTTTVEVRGLTFTNSTGAAINFSSPSKDKYLHITDSTLSGGENGISLGNGTKLIIDTQQTSGYPTDISGFVTGIQVNAGCIAELRRVRFHNCTMFGISLANGSIIDEMSNCIVENCQNSGICCSNSQMNNLYGNTFKNITYNGIYMSNSSTLQLKSPENTFDSCPYGISSADSSLTLDTGSCHFTNSSTALLITNPTTTVEVRGLTFTNSTSAAINFSSPSKDKYLHITDSTLSGGENGISLGNGTKLIIDTQQTSGYPTDISGFVTGIIVNAGCIAELRRVRFHNCTKNALYVPGAENLLVENCLFEDVFNSEVEYAKKAFCLSMIAVGNATVRYSTFRNSDKAVYASNTTLTSEYCTIEDCHYFEAIGLHDGSTGLVQHCNLNRCLAGVSVRTNSKADILYNSIEESKKVSNTTTPFGQGIFIQHGSQANTSHNTIINCDNEGIYIYNSTGTVTDNYISNNGHVVKDGNGIFCDNSTMTVADNYVSGNYLYGVSLSGTSSKIYQNEIHNNRQGGIYITSGSLGGDIRFNYCSHNDKILIDDPLFVPCEIRFENSGTDGLALGNTFYGNDKVGAGIQDSGKATFIGNLVASNVVYNFNLFNNAIISLQKNIIDDSQNGVFINNSQCNPATYNEITNATVGGAKSINTIAVSDFSYCWWGSATGPTSTGNPGGTGTIAENVTYSPWLTSPFSRYGVFENITIASAGQSLLLQKESIPFVHLYLTASQSFQDGVVSLLFAADQNILYDYPYSEDKIGQGRFLIINACYALRHNLSGCELRIYPDAYAFPGLNPSQLAIKKVDIYTKQWVNIPGSYNAGLGCLTANLTDPQGAYIIVRKTGTANGWVLYY